MTVKFPQVSVPLVGQDGNAFTILGRVGGAMRDAGVSSEEIDAFRNEAMSGDYDHLLQTVLRTVNVGDPDDWDDDDWDEYEREDDDSWVNRWGPD